ncbi:MAG TPA: amylo-alpha-1,6-glucosidase [Candidatus Solibacter sp.]|nr:amylo-alpha-1,6-glucosidase [Candidatus Solibacter sp.]
MMSVTQPDTREWLETNGIGGYASSTVSGMNTRRYHGLLVAATKPPVGRMVLLSKLEDTLVLNGRRFELSCNHYPGVIHPQGYRYLTEFRRDPFPVFVYEVEGVTLEKRVFMVRGENTTVIQYEFRGATPQECVLELSPLIAFRDYHSMTHENGAIHGTLAIAPGRVMCSPYPGCPEFHLAHTDGEVRPIGDWYRNFEYTIEEQRGLDFREDLFNPMMLTFDLAKNPRPALIASTEPKDASTADKLRAAETERRRDLDPLEQAADQFLVRRGEGHTVIAGYHWFSDWGRDTMISLPGLTLPTGRFDEARGVLTAFAQSIDRGMLPNRFPDAGETPEYNTVDATLWFFEAVRAFAESTSDYEFIRTRLYDVLSDIVAWHERGTRYGIRVDSDGLLEAGEPGVQLTWMDAKVGDWVVTPRRGKPVEIQALWYNTLCVMQAFSEQFGGRSDVARYSSMAQKARESFAAQFWNETAGCLYDAVNGTDRDASIRPNQVFAVSLPHTMLDSDKAAAVVATVQQHLLTPYGLRTLAPSDPQYRGRYEGDQWHRDSAYHQGTVWPWLMGPFVTAYLKVNGRSPQALDQVSQWLSELRRYMTEEGLGQIPEVFDGDTPHRPGGCIAQAWSVAELLRVTRMAARD